MGNITNNYAEGSCVFEAGSSQNGDITISGNIYQGGAKNNDDDTPQPVMSQSKGYDDDNLGDATPSPASAKNEIISDEELFHFIHPEVEDSEEVKIHQAVKKLVKRFGVKEICDYLSQMADEKKILLPQGVKVAYDELVRMGMPNGEGFALKTFEKYYRK